MIMLNRVIKEPLFVEIEKYIFETYGGGNYKNYFEKKKEKSYVKYLSSLGP